MFSLRRQCGRSRGFVKFWAEPAERPESRPTRPGQPQKSPRIQLELAPTRTRRRNRDGTVGPLHRQSKHPRPWMLDDGVPAAPLIALEPNEGEPLATERVNGHRHRHCLSFRG
jgi:hypothetical protein